jgi:group I intron endonuclease
MSIEKQKNLWEENGLIELPMKFGNNGESVECGIITDTNVLNENVPLNDIIVTKQKISGIYKIINKINGKYYVGSSKNIHKRWLYHKEDLKNNKHHSQHLQRSWNKYGFINFDFVIVEEILKENLQITEQKYLNVAKQEKEMSYNGTFIVGRVEMTDEIKRKISISNKLFHTGKHSGINNIMYGKHHTAAVIQNLKNDSRCKHIGISNPFYGKHHTDKTKEKMRLKLIDTNNYLIKNIKTKEVFNGTRLDFITQFGLRKGTVNALINGQLNSYKGWILIVK